MNLGGALTREQFLLRETQIVADFRLRGIADEDAEKQIKDENLFQYPTEKMIANKVHVGLRRIGVLNTTLLQNGLTEEEASLLESRFLNLLTHGTHDQAVQLNMYLMIKNYIIVERFMMGEIGDRLSNFDYSFSAMDMGSFVTRFQMEFSQAATWSDSTVTRLKSSLKQILYCAGFMIQNSEALQGILVDFEVEELLRDMGEAKYLHAFDGREE